MNGIDDHRINVMVDEEVSSSLAFSMNEATDLKKFSLQVGLGARTRAGVRIYRLPISLSTRKENRSQLSRNSQV